MLFRGHRSESARQEILASLQDFESFCMGEKSMSPTQFQNLNVKLSIQTVLNIGRRQMIDHKDGARLLWITPDERAHDLGPVGHRDVTTRYPGFSRGSSLALGQKDVLTHEVVDVPQVRRFMTVVTLRDGTGGVGPDFKTALRNAVLRRYLSTVSRKRSNGFSRWMGSVFF